MQEKPHLQTSAKTEEQVVVAENHQEGQRGARAHGEILVHKGGLGIHPWALTHVGIDTMVSIWAAGMSRHSAKAGHFQCLWAWLSGAPQY